MQRIDPCEEIRKARDALQTQIEACHRLLDSAGIKGNPDLRQRVEYALNVSTLGSQALDDVLAKLKMLVQDLESPDAPA